MHPILLCGHRVQFHHPQVAPTAALAAELAEATGAAMELLAAVGDTKEVEEMEEEQEASSGPCSSAGGAGNGFGAGGARSPPSRPSSRGAGWGARELLPSASTLAMLARSMVQLGITPDGAWQVGNKGRGGGG